MTRIDRHDLPLPTEPGERFWGKTPDTDPQWWFLRDAGPHDGSWYFPARGPRLPARDAVQRGLVRLPDPNTSGVTA